MDGNELGNEEGTYTALKVDGFIKKLLKAEAGSEYSSLKDPDHLYNLYKANLIEARNRADNEVESNGNVMVEGKEEERLLDSKHNLRVGDDGLIYVDVMSYISNPILKDTDYDGIDDGYGKENIEKENQYRDEKPLDNSISGYITMVNNKELKIDTSMDYRYFFMEPYNYYDELSVMSLLLTNAITDKNVTNLSNIEKINEVIGLNLEKREAVEDMVNSKYIYKTDYAIGHKEVEYSKDNTAENKIKKVVIPIIIPAMNKDSDGRSYSEIGSVDWVEKNKEIDGEVHNVMSYEIYAESILNEIRYYESLNKDSIPADKATDVKKVYWVMGYKEGGAIANILASKLIDEKKVVYAYTFGSPMTIYNNSDMSGYTRTGYSVRYDSIFNVVNECDAYCFIMPQSLGFSRYGKTCIGGTAVYNPKTKIFEMDYESVERILEEIKKLYKNSEREVRKKTYAKDTNPNKSKNYAGLYNVFQRLIRAIDIERNNKKELAIVDNNIDTLEEFYNRYGNVTDLSTFINAIKTNYNKIKRAGEEDVYFMIAGNMKNENIMNVVNIYDNKKIRRASASNAEVILLALDDMGKEYCNTIGTYQAQFRNKSYTTSTDGEYVKEYNIKTNVAVRGINKSLNNKIYNVNIAAYTASKSEANLLKNKTVNLTEADEKRILNFIEQDEKGKMERNGGILLYPNKYINGANKYEKAGDDCVRFAFSTYQSINPQFIEKLEKYSGNVWSNINSTKLIDEDNVAYGMYKLGFDVYDYEIAESQWKDKNGDGIDDFYMNRIDENFELEPGDLLARKGHVQFVLEKLSKGEEKSLETFGWGEIKSTYPYKSTFKVEKDDDNNYIVKQGNATKYTRVYRYNGIQERN